VAARSKAWVFGRSSAEDCGFDSHKRHGWMSVVSVVCCCQVEVYCDELITCPEESYRL